MSINSSFYTLAGMESAFKMFPDVTYKAGCSVLETIVSMETGKALIPAGDQTSHLSLEIKLKPGIEVNPHYLFSSITLLRKGEKIEELTPYFLDVYYDCFNHEKETYQQLIKPINDIFVLPLPFFFTRQKTLFTILNSEVEITLSEDYKNNVVERIKLISHVFLYPRTLVPKPKDMYAETITALPSRIMTKDENQGYYFDDRNTVKNIFYSLRHRKTHKYHTCDFIKKADVYREMANMMSCSSPQTVTTLQHYHSNIIPSKNHGIINFSFDANFFNTFQGSCSTIDRLMSLHLALDKNINEDYELVVFVTECKKIPIYDETENKEINTNPKIIAKSSYDYIGNIKRNYTVLSSLKNYFGFNSVQTLKRRGNILEEYTDILEQLLRNENIVGIINNIFPEGAFINQFTENNLFPGQGHVSFHQDPPHHLVKSDKVLGIQIMILLTNFTKENGGTLIKYNNENYVITGEIGDVYLWKSDVYHTEGVNNTSETRSCLLLNIQSVDAPKIDFNLGGEDVVKTFYEQYTLGKYKSDHIIVDSDRKICRIK